MNPYIGFTILMALSLFLNNQPAQTSLEKRAVGDTRRTLASDLDAELPRLPFGDWFEKVVGPGVGVTWQLSECGEKVEEASNGTGDARACVEANTILTDGRRVIVLIAVGTFKKGMTGPPAFNFGVIERKGELRLIRRLRDLQNLLLNPEKLPKRPAVKLPDLDMAGVRLAPNNASVSVTPAWSGEDFGRLLPIEDLEPPPARPPLRAERSDTQGGVLQGAPKVKPQPTYPRSNNAKRFNASGPVEVQVTISATGRVTAAKAIKGHPLLREAAVDAARRWEFEPTTIDGVPMETQLTLTFIFTVPPQ
jgi:TonB family protein